MSRLLSKAKSFVADSRDLIEFCIDVEELSFPAASAPFQVFIIFDKNGDDREKRTVAESDRATVSKEKSVQAGEVSVKIAAKLSLRSTLTSLNGCKSYEDKFACCKVVKVHTDGGLESLGVMFVPLSEMINSAIAIEGNIGDVTKHAKLNTRMIVSLEDCCLDQMGAKLTYTCSATAVDNEGSSHLQFLKKLQKAKPPVVRVHIPVSEIGHEPDEMSESVPVEVNGDAAMTPTTDASAALTVQTVKAADVEVKSDRKVATPVIAPAARPRTLKKTASMFKKSDQVDFIVTVESIDFPVAQKCCRIKMILEKATENAKLTTVPDSEKSDISRERLIKEGANWIDPEARLNLRSTMKTDLTGMEYEDKSAVCKVVLIMSDRSARFIGRVFVPLHMFLNAAVHDHAGSSNEEEHFRLNRRLSAPLLDTPVEFEGTTMTYHLMASAVDSSKNSPLNFLKNLTSVDAVKPRVVVAPVLSTALEVKAVNKTVTPVMQKADVPCAEEQAVAAAAVDTQKTQVAEADRLCQEYEVKQCSVRQAEDAAATADREHKQASESVEEVAVEVRKSTEIMAAELAEKPRQVWNCTSKPLLLKGQTFTRPTSGGLGAKTVRLIMQPITSIELALEYFEVAPDNPTIPKVGAKITKIDISAITKLSVKSGCVICLTHAAKAYEFTAPSDSVQMQWVEAIKMANEMMRKRFNHAALLEDVPKIETDMDDNSAPVNASESAVSPTSTAFVASQSSSNSSVSPSDKTHIADSTTASHVPIAEDKRRESSYKQTQGLKVAPDIDVAVVVATGTSGASNSSDKFLSGHSEAEFQALKVKFDALTESYRMLSAEKEILKRALQTALAKGNRSGVNAGAAAAASTNSTKNGSNGEFTFTSVIGGSRASVVDPSVTEYQINCVWKPKGSTDETESIKWSLWKRYSQFHKLHVEMKPLMKGVDAKITQLVKNSDNRERSNSMESTLSQASNKLQFPPKYIFVHNLKSIEHRREQLNSYWEALTSRVQLTEFDLATCSAQLKTFLEVAKYTEV